MKTLADELLINAIDMHCHCYPEFSLKAMKRMEDIEWINLAARMGMRGAVLKSHFWPTMSNVYYLKHHIPEGFELFSSITLNVNCGGIVSWVVETAASLGAKVVWMPTWSAENEKAKSTGNWITRFVPSLEGYQYPGLRVLDAEGLIPEVRRILRIVKEKDMVLFTGHLSASECLAMAKESKKIGFKKLVFGHPDYGSIKASIQEMKEVIELGGYVEFCFLGTLPLLQRKHPKDMVALIKEVGADHCILTTDLFYDWVPPEPEIMRMGIASLLDQGISENEMRTMVQYNPAKLLGIEAPKNQFPLSRAAI